MNKVILNDLQELSNRPLDLNKLENKTIMVFGINSLIGRYFCLYLLYLNENKGLNMNIIGTTRNIEKTKKYFGEYIDNNLLEVVVQDVEDEIVYDKDVDIIIDTVGYASAYHIVNNPVDIIKANTIGTMNILDFAKKKNVKKVLFTSTREVYGKVNDVSTIDENDIGSMNQLELRSCYPESKKLAENLFVCYSEQYSIPYVILRIAHTYGPTMALANDGRVMADFINYYVNKKDIVLNSDGTTKRSFCYITDTIYGMMLALLGPDNEVYNLSNEREPMEIRDVAQMIVSCDPEQRLKVQINIPEDSNSLKGYNKIPVVPMSTEKIESLGWEPNVSLNDGIKRTIDFFDEESNK